MDQQCYALIILSAMVLYLPNSKQDIFCYEQYCEKKNSGWVCKYPGKGNKVELIEDEVCFEGKKETEEEEGRIIRFGYGTWHFEEDIAKLVKKNGRECRDDEHFMHFCLCDKELCNDEFDLPEKFEVNKDLDWCDSSENADC